MILVPTHVIPGQDREGSQGQARQNEPAAHLQIQVRHPIADDCVTDDSNSWSLIRRNPLWPSKTARLSSIPSTTILLALTAILAGLCTPAGAQIYTSFDAFSSGATFPYQMDVDGSISVITSRRTAHTSRLLIPW